MHLSKSCPILLTIVCFVSLPAVSADDFVYHLADNNRPDVMLFSFEKSFVLRDKSGESRFKGHPSAEGTGKIKHVALSPDGKTYAYSTWLSVSSKSANGAGYLVLCETESGRMLWKAQAHPANACCLTFSPDGNLLATGSWDTHARIWSASTGELLSDLAGHTDSVYDVEFSPDGTLLATGSADGTVRLWNWSQEVSLVTYKPVAFSPFDRGNPDVYDVAFTPDGKYLVSSHYNKLLCLWNIAEEKISSRYQLPFCATKLVMSRDGRRVACFDERALLVWNLQTGKRDLIFGKRFGGGVEDIASISGPIGTADLMILDARDKFWICNMSPTYKTPTDPAVE